MKKPRFPHFEVFKPLDHSKQHHDLLGKETKTIQVGPKQKHLTIPEGWKLLTEGKVEDRDKFCNVGNQNAPYWEYVDSEDIGESVEDYDFLIREINRTPRP